jgi:hypothetical protein
MSHRHLHTMRGIRRLQCVIGHIVDNDGIGKLIRMCIEATQLEVGAFEPCVFLRHSLCGHTTLTNSWVHEIWSFLELFQGAITISNKWTPSPQRVSDQSIMSLAVLFTTHKGKIQQINMCRIFLGAIYVSGITDFDGISILQQSYDGTRTDNYPTIRRHNQQHPTKGRLLVWGHFLHHISDNNRYLLQPLGLWNDVSTWYHRGEWFISTHNRTLVHKVGNQWFWYNKQGHGNSQYSLVPSLLHQVPTLKSTALGKRHHSSF